MTYGLSMTSLPTQLPDGEIMSGINRLGSDAYNAEGGTDWYRGSAPLLFTSTLRR